MNKNLIIAILGGFVILASIWGSVGNNNSRILKKELKQAKAEIEALRAQQAKVTQQEQGTVGQLQQQLAACNEKNVKARKELIVLRKANKALEARLTERGDELQKLGQTIISLKKARSEEKQKAETLAGGREEKAAQTEGDMISLQQRLKEKNVQVALMQQKVKEMEKLVDPLKKELAAKEEQVARLTQQLKVRGGQLATLQKALQEENNRVEGLQAKLDKRDTRVARLKQQMATMKQDLEKKIAALEKAVSGNAAVRMARQKLAATQKKLAATEAKVQDLQKQLDASTKAARMACQPKSKTERELEAANAQIVGLEKIIEEKNANLDEVSNELDRVKINMNVLLSKIREQKDSLQELRNENHELVKELAAKNALIADLQEQSQTDANSSSN